MTLPVQQESIPPSDGSLPDIYAQLSGAAQSAKVDLLFRAVEANTDSRVRLPAVAAKRANLDDIDLSAPSIAPRVSGDGAHQPWWNSQLACVNLKGADLHGANMARANLQGVDLREADLGDARLGEANLSLAMLEQANLEGADMAGARLEGAVLGEASMHRTMLEEAVMTGANLRFADLTDAVLEGAQLAHADFWGAKADGLVLLNANLQNVSFRETHLSNANLVGADLRGAVLNKTVLTAANLRGANLQGATLTGVDLEGAVLAAARLQGVVLTSSNIKHAFFSGAKLAKTELEQDQLGGAIGEELAGDYEAARSAYLALERNFQDLGDQDAAGWAYGKRRRMQKLATREQARKEFKQGKWASGIKSYGKFTNNQMAEWLCDYGESIPRVLLTMLIIYILFTIIYGLTGSVVRIKASGSAPANSVTYNPLDLAIFSLLAMTTSGSPVVGLLPHDEIVHILTGIQALIGIFLTGLLGFVVGNRIRR